MSDRTLRIEVDLGRELDADDVAYLAALREALLVYRDRSAERRGLWKRAGGKGMAVQVFSKAERGFAEAMRGEIPSSDHYVDLINYAAFALALKDNMNGEWPWETDSQTSSGLE